MSKIIFVVLFLCSVSSVFAQQQRPMKPHYLSGFVEISGQTGYVSPYCDYLLHYPNKRIHHAFAVGFTLYSYELVREKIVVPMIPLQYNLLVGKSPNYFETGVGITTMLLPEYRIQLSPFSQYAYGIVPAHEVYMFAPRLGYRYQDINGGLFGKFSIVPANFTWRGERIEPFLPVSLSLGYTF